MIISRVRHACPKHCLTRQQRLIHTSVPHSITTPTTSPRLFKRSLTNRCNFSCEKSHSNHNNNECTYAFFAQRSLKLQRSSRCHYSTMIFQQRLENSSTIFAISSGGSVGGANLSAGKVGDGGIGGSSLSMKIMSQVSAIAVVRISGPKASLVLSEMAHSMSAAGNSAETKLKILPRRAHYCRLRHPKSGQELDRALCLYFPGPNSFTGEDVVELHIHGGYSVQCDVMQALSDLDDSFQVAQPGDFTKRAFMNGKMDLTEVEALSDLLHAQTEQQRLQALKQLDGSLSKVIDSWSKDVMYAVAHLTAYIDFGEDDDINHTVFRLILPRIENLCQQINKHLSQGNKGERLRNGAQVALLGPPNAGKSSLLNVLAKRPVAIVSDIQGTTRDVVEVHLNIEGYAVTVADTAGIRQDQNEYYATQSGISLINDIEREGMIRALDRAKDADVLVLVMDPDDTEANEHCLQRLKSQYDPQQQHLMIVHNKSDKVSRSSTQDMIAEQFSGLNNTHQFSLSCKTGDGVDEFVQHLGECMKSMFAPVLLNTTTSAGSTLAQNQNHHSTVTEVTSANTQQEQIIITRERHRQALQNCLENLKLFLQYHEEIDIAAEYLRQAHGYLASITGHVDTEDILGLVFKEFCIGK